MGFIRHNAIIVTGFREEDMVRALALAEGCGLAISDAVSSPINGYYSFLVAPDGSKEGWAGSAKGDEQRAAFIAQLRAAENLYVDWVHVTYGGDYRNATVVDHSDLFPGES